jgi:hypothetical protein
MKKRKSEITKRILLSSLFILFSIFVYAQEGQQSEYQKLEKLQDQNVENYMKIYKVIDRYPDFKYSYVYDNDGKIEKVIVEGVVEETDRKKLEILIFEFKNNKIKMQNTPTRTGIYYSVDQEAEPKMGMEKFYDNLRDKITYPEEAKKYGVEGNVYLKFVVDSKGEIAYINAQEDIETSTKPFVKDLMKQAKNAVMETSGNWEPAMVNGDPVASWVVLPVAYNIEQYVGYPAMIR